MGSTFQQDISRYIEGLAEYSSDIFWIKKTDFSEQIYISPSYEIIWGRSCESMYADPKSWTDYIFPEDLQRLHATIENFRNTISKGASYTEKYRVKKPDGEVCWIREKGFAIFDSSDELIGIGGVAQDITSLVTNQRVEQEIKVLSDERSTYEEFLRSVVESLAGNHWWKDREGVYRGYNNALLKSLGYHSASDILGKTDYELPWGDQAEHVVAHDREVMRRGVSIEREEVVTSNHGERRIYLVNKAPLRDLNGEIIGTIGHGFDITDMKMAREELERVRQEIDSKQSRMESHLKAIVNGTVGSHWVKNLDGEYVACSSPILDLFGLDSEEDVIGKTDEELPWASEAESFAAMDREVIKEDRTISKEVAVRTLDGEMRHFIAFRAPVHDVDNNIVGIMGSATDITEIKWEQEKIKEEKDRAVFNNKMKSDLLTSLSTELRTPLNVIQGCADILERKITDAYLKKNILDIKDSINSLLDLTSTILDSARIDENDFLLNSVPFDVAALVKDVLENFGYLDKLSLDFSKDIPTTVVGDSVRLKQVLLNLIGFSLKFDEHTDAKLVVTPDVIGLANITLLFDFSNLCIKAPQDKHNGSGLIFCRQIVEMIGGEIHIEKTKDAISRLWFTVPLKLPIDARKSVKKILSFEESEQGSQQYFENCSMLVIEDNILNQKVTKLLLEDLGCRVDIASDAQAALALIEKNDYDAIFVDVGLPTIDGITLTKRIRSNPEMRDTVIIAITAHASHEDIQLCYDAQMNEVLTKPVSIDDFRKVLSVFCAEKMVEKTSA